MLIIQKIIVGVNRNGSAVLYDLINIKDKKIEDAGWQADNSTRSAVTSSADGNNKIGAESQHQNKKNSQEYIDLAKDPDKNADYEKPITIDDIKLLMKMLRNLSEISRKK